MLAAACGQGTPDANYVSTMVAATVMAAGGSPAISTESVPSSSETGTAALVVTEETPSPIRVSFVTTAHNLFVWSDGTGTPVQLTSSGDVHESYVSPDGSMIAFTRSVDEVNYQVDVINYDGTDQRTLLSPSQINALPRPDGSLGLEPGKVVWIPGSHVLALNFRVLFEGPGLQYAESLYTLNADTAAFSALIPVGDAWNFVFSPDGSKLVVTRPEAVDLYNANGSLVLANVITHVFINTASEYAWVGTPTWAADSSAFALGIPPQDPWTDDPEPSMIYKISSAGTVLSSSSVVTMYLSPDIVSFNSELTKMAFSVRVGAPTDNTWALHMADINGSGDTLVMNGNSSNLILWTLDGGHYLFTVRSGSTRQTFLGSSASAPLLLDEIPLALEMRWLDNSRFVVASKDGATVSLLLGSVDGSFGVIYNDPGPEPDRYFNFDVNR